MLVDQAKIFLRAGKGGGGCLSFHREKYVPRGGPDGGDGGRGGHIFLRTNPNLHTLADFAYRKIYQSPPGGPGEGGNRHGHHGEDIILSVPVGTEVIDAQTGELLADLSREGMEFLAARGGQGGKGNARFKSSTNRTPRQRELGEAGQEQSLVLELKVLADVGLLGFPNAGKSTFISRISAARPKVASYAFTTLEPALGVWELPGGPIVVADVPGIIEGAHQGKGLGLRFLKHLERTGILLYLIDFSVPSSEIPPWDQYTALRSEVVAYGKRLADKPYLVIATKMDLPTAVENWCSQADLFREKEIFPIPISALAGSGIEDLARDVDALLPHKGRKLNVCVG